MDERESGALDGGRTRPVAGGAATRLEALKAIGWSIQSPRPTNPACATPEEREAFKKSLSKRPPGRPQPVPVNLSRSRPRTSPAAAVRLSRAGSGRRRASAPRRQATIATNGSP